MVCSDGLNDMIGQAGIDHCVEVSKDSTDLVTRLVAEALRAGGEDNVSVAVVTVGEHPVREPVDDAGPSEDTPE
jgi:protein phosphatase